MNLFPELERLLRGLGVTLHLATVVPMFALVLARLLSAFTLTPFLGGSVVTPQVRMGLASVMALLLYPWVVATETVPALTVVFWASLMVKEILLGALIGFCVQLVFGALQMAGELIEFSMGLREEQVLAPQLSTRVSLLGQLKLQTALALFLTANGHLLFFRAFADSFAAVPLFQFPGLRAGPTGLALEAGRITMGTLRAAVELSFPVIAVLVLVEAAFGLMQRIAPQVQIRQDSPPIKIWLGFGMLLLTAAFIYQRAWQYFLKVLEEIAQYLQKLA